MRPLISIITINFNNADGLLKTMTSVFEQKSDKYEYVIVDGFSTDNSVNVIKRFGDDKPLNWISEQDEGIYDAMNKGISMAKGEYLLFLNSGDYLSSPDVIHNVALMLKGEDIVYGDLYQNVNGRMVETIYPSTVSEKFFFLNSIPHPASFIRKEALQKLGCYNTSLKIVSDWEFFFLAVVKYHFSYKHIPMLITVYDLNGLSHKQASLAKEERAIVMNEHFRHLWPKYNYVVNIERKFLVPYRLMKRGYRFVQRLFNVNRVFVNDI